jgi:predicted DNA-binding transcriptional regulator YafY
MRQQQKKPLPRYVECNLRNGKLSFRVDRCARIPLPKDPTTPEFRRAYNEALVDAITAEDDSDDWSELEAMHKAQRRGTAKHGGQR